MKFFTLLLGTVFIAIANSLPAQEAWDLERCLRYAEETNLGLRQSRLDLLTSDINLKEARSARHPSLNANSGTSWNYGRTFDPFTNDRVDRNVNGFNFGLGVSVPVFTGFRILNRIEQANLNQKIASLNLADAENVLGLNIANAYLTILLNQEILEQRRAQVETTLEQRDRMRKLVDAGTMAQTSYLELNAQLALDESNAVNADNSLQLAYLQLQQLLTLEPSENFRVITPDLPEVGETLEVASANEIYNYAEETQPNIQSADLTIQSAEKQIAVARSSAFPSLSFNANTGTGYSKEIGTNINVSQALEDNIDYTFSFGLNIPIYNRRQVRSAVQRAEIQLQQAELASVQERQDLRQTIEQAYLDLRNTFAQYQQITQQIESQQLAFENAEKQFELGVINSVEYLLAQNNLQIALLNQIQLKYQYHFRSKILDFYLGKPLEF